MRTEVSYLHDEEKEGEGGSNVGSEGDEGWGYCL